MTSMTIQEALRTALKQAATSLPQDVVAALRAARARETSTMAATQLDAILENVAIAQSGGIPLCQDTGIQTFFVKAGFDSPFLKELTGGLPRPLLKRRGRSPFAPTQ